MIPYGIVYTDNIASLKEGAKIWQKKSDIINKKLFVLFAVILSVLIILINRFVLSFYEEPEVHLMSSVFLTVTEIIVVIAILLSTIRRSLFNAFVQVNSSKKVKQAVLRENDVVFSTQFSKSNYYYDEILCIVEGMYSLNFVIEKNALPICISKMSLEKGNIDKFISVLKDKMGDKYITDIKGDKRK